MEDSLKEKTGKSLSHWKTVVRKSGLSKHSEIVRFLKDTHGFTHGFANFVSLKAREADAGSIDDKTLLKNQYEGKEHLKPIYEKIVSHANDLGDDVQIVPKKSSVSLRRKKQFALVQPSTKTRIDLGLKLRNKEVSGRLENSGPFGSMCTHRVRLEKTGDVDDQVKGWLKEAYEEAD